MHYYKINNEIMQYSIFGNDIALIMHYRALFTMSGLHIILIILYKIESINGAIPENEMVFSYSLSYYE